MTEPIDQATKDLIEKEAIAEFPDKPDTGLVYNNSARRSGYIAGATVWAEKLKQLETQSHDQVRIIEHLEEKLKKERNKAIQSCIEVLINDDRIHFNASDWLEKLESLKDKSHE